MTAKLYALLIGINQYQNKNIRTLQGCVADVELLEKYLGGIVPPQALQLKTLTEEAATKANVCATILSHFKDATAGDTLLLYFAGHGCKEQMHPAFARFEKEPYLKALVCHDSLDSATSLADKEIRYLFHQIFVHTNGARLIFITDACHSGGVSRMQIARERLGPEAPQRNWKSFVFGDILPESVLSASSTLSEVLPQGIHIHLAACEPDQTAVEINENGIFTSHLIEVLNNSVGPVALSDLFSRIRLRLLRRYQQVPALYYVTTDGLPETDLSQQIRLGNVPLWGEVSLAIPELRHNVVFNADKGGWLMDAGALHGLQPEQLGIANMATITQSNADEPLSAARFVRIGAGESLIVPDEPGNLTITETYSGVFHKALKQPLNLYCAGLKEDSRDGLRITLQGSNTQLVDNPDTADYYLRPGKEAWSIIRVIQTDKASTEELVCKSVVGTAPKVFRDLKTDLDRIAHWHFVRDIGDVRSGTEAALGISWTLECFPGELYVLLQSDGKPPKFQPGREGALTSIALSDLDGKTLDLHWLKPALPGAAPYIRMRIRLNNTSGKTIYAGVAFLDQLFGVYDDVMPGGVVRLLPGQKEMGFGDAGRYKIPNGSLGRFSPADDFVFLKLFLSTAPFSLDPLTQEPLLPPDYPGKRDALQIGEPGESTYPSVDRWSVQTIKIDFHQPLT